MLAAIIPVRNEESRIGRLLLRLRLIKDISRIIVVLNGSDQFTIDEVEAVYRLDPFKMVNVHFPIALGIDVPRAVGAYLAYTSGMSHVLFMDGDLIGEITEDLNSFINASLSRKLDLSLVNCYPGKSGEISSNELMICFRHLLNRELKLDGELGSASPSHGPHLVSRRLLEAVPWNDFAVPPTLLVHARQNNLKIGIGGDIPHARLGSSIKSQLHCDLIVDTIAGDCLEALCLWRRVPRARGHGGRIYRGYHPERRFDLLNEFLSGHRM
ncbi:MAG: glycosyltransferase family 2 protein [Dethiobacter sp.]|nr:glycosyltransferase family 2 protein [Dethiobacter sp.]